METNPVLKAIHELPKGYSEGFYLGQKYGITKSVFNAGKSFKVFAKALGGTNTISLNYYVTAGKDLLKPCEMPEEKVIHFLKNIQKVCIK